MPSRAEWWTAASSPVSRSRSLRAARGHPAAHAARVVSHDLSSSILSLSCGLVASRSRSQGCPGFGAPGFTDPVSAAINRLSVAACSRRSSSSPVHPPEPSPTHSLPRCAGAEPPRAFSPGLTVRRAADGYRLPSSRSRPALPLVVSRPSSASPGSTAPFGLVVGGCVPRLARPQGLAPCVDPLRPDPFPDHGRPLLSWASLSSGRRVVASRCDVFRGLRRGRCSGRRSPVRLAGASGWDSRRF